MRRSGLTINGFANGLNPQTEKSILAIRSDGTLLSIKYQDRVVRLESALSPSVAAVMGETPSGQNHLLKKL